MAFVYSAVIVVLALPMIVAAAALSAIAVAMPGWVLLTMLVVRDAGAASFLLSGVADDRLAGDNHAASVFGVYR